MDTETKVEEVEEVTLESLKSTIDKQTLLIDKFRTQEKNNQAIAKDSGADTLVDALTQLRNMSPTQSSPATEETTEWKDKFTKVDTELSMIKSKIEQETKLTAIKEQLGTYDISAVDTVMKLLDITKLDIKDGKVDAAILKTQVETLKESDPVLFGKVSKKAPILKQADNNEVNVSDFNTQIKACKTQAELDAVWKAQSK